MILNDPEYLYLILVLPTLFGLTLIGNGIHKILNNEEGGSINLIFGMLFIGLVIFVFSSYLIGHGV